MAENFKRGDEITLTEPVYINCIVMPEGNWRDWTFDEARRWLEFVIERNRKPATPPEVA